MRRVTWFRAVFGLSPVATERTSMGARGSSINASRTRQSSPDNSCFNGARGPRERRGTPSGRELGNSAARFHRARREAESPWRPHAADDARALKLPESKVKDNIVPNPPRSFTWSETGARHEHRRNRVNRSHGSPRTRRRHPASTCDDRVHASSRRTGRYRGTGDGNPWRRSKPRGHPACSPWARRSDLDCGPGRPRTNDCRQRRGTCRTHGHAGSGRAPYRHRERFRHRRAPPLDLDQLGPLDPSEAIRRLCPDGTTGRLERPRLDHRPSSLPLEWTDDWPRPKRGRSKGSRARSLSHLPRGSRGHASRSGRGLESSRRGALSERGERRRLNRDGTRSELLFPCPTSEEHRLDRTQGEGHGLVEAHFLPRRPRRGEGLFIQRLLDGSQPLLIFRPLIRV